MDLHCDLSDDREEAYASCHVREPARLARSRRRSRWHPPVDDPLAHQLSSEGVSQHPADLVRYAILPASSDDNDDGLDVLSNHFLRLLPPAFAVFALLRR